MLCSAGFGGQIGAELTDFVMILNDSNAVKTFAQVGSITLGGNVSVAAGPVGRNAEASGAASLRSVAGIFSYRCSTIPTRQESLHCRTVADLEQ